MFTITEPTSGRLSGPCVERQDRKGILRQNLNGGGGENLPLYTCLLALARETQGEGGDLGPAHSEFEREKGYGYWAGCAFYIRRCLDSRVARAIYLRKRFPSWYMGLGFYLLEVFGWLPEGGAEMCCVRFCVFVLLLRLVIPGSMHACSQKMSGSSPCYS
ncbi:hypothetical protein GQ53DRAFT_234998 [Thozetella sp. PMI_491]|nr:hypothetical protein GQ53DRAFT_234998 [Thozetella sp. PMI_491]